MNIFFCFQKEICALIHVQVVKINELLDMWISINEISFYFHIQANKIYIYTNDNKKIIMIFLLKSLGPIDRKFHGHGENDGFVLYEYIIKQCSSLCKYTNISVMGKKSNKIICQQ